MSIFTRPLSGLQLDFLGANVQLKFCYSRLSL